MNRNPHLPLTIKTVEPAPEKNYKVKKPGPPKVKTNRPPAIYSNKSQQEIIEKYLNMDL